ncbi:DUF488 domain-containing protein [Prevotella intermedia]|uniref:DUF488 domain-containing protein n=1 Tax=Prevotella intermedia TaxID=28131 RepID=UPI000C1C00B4|nr:DUF488 family protein [Prevotella intermedia]ATV38614.1 DUF488 domain-containing protein [Prevotella intermedia]
MKKANELKIKRVYLTPEEGDGYRILIDRLWPRGIAKEKACIDEWNKAIAPSSELRKWFGHKEENYATFAEKYRSELDNNPEAMPFTNHIKALLESSNVTLLYGAKSENCNHAIILRDWLISK